MNDDKKYFQNAIDGFQHGCLLDLRVRWAIELLKDSPLMSRVFPQGYPMETADPIMYPASIAALALDVATKLLSLAEERGLLKPLPNNPELSQELKHAGQRLGAFEVMKQLGAQRTMREEQSGIVPMQAHVANALKKPN